MKSFLPTLLSNLFFLVILLASAGSQNYWPAWALRGHWSGDERPDTIDPAQGP
jgi:hypothetical protein